MGKRLTTALGIGVIGGAMLVSGCNTARSRAVWGNLGYDFLSSAVMQAGANFANDAWNSESQQVPKNVYKGNDGLWYPVKGYAFLNPRNDNDLRVIKIEGNEKLLEKIYGIKLE